MINNNKQLIGYSAQELKKEFLLAIKQPNKGFSIIDKEDLRRQAVFNKEQISRLDIYA